MSNRGIAAVLAVWCVCGAVAAHAHEPERFAVSLHLLVDGSITSRLDTRVLEEEASGIWRPYGVQLEWPDARAADTGANGFALDVRLQPRIEESRHAPWSTVLGSARVDLVSPDRQPIRVSVDATESVLNLRRGLGITGFVTDRELARGLGRVLAHEIGHVLLGAPYHDDTGLMRAVFLPDELAEPDGSLFRLTCTDVARLSARLHVLTGDPRFARRRGWNGPEYVGGSYGIEGRELSAQCIQGGTLR
jgi:hypothetical protein